jgi:hypothetical protein
VQSKSFEVAAEVEYPESIHRIHQVRVNLDGEQLVAVGAKEELEGFRKIHLGQGERAQGRETRV